MGRGRRRKKLVGLLIAIHSFIGVRVVPKTLVFVETKRLSDQVAIMLSYEKIKVMSINGYVISRKLRSFEI